VTDYTPEIQMAYCIACGTQNRADSTFCLDCGERLFREHSSTSSRWYQRYRLPARIAGPVGGVASLLAGLICWIVGDGHSAGVDPPIPDSAKFVIVLLGWLYIIDGVRILTGRRSFMRFVYRYCLYLALGALSVALVIWLYGALSLKGLVAIGLAVAIALLVFILRELRGSRA